MTEGGPSKDELRQLGIELVKATRSVVEAHPGLEIIFSYALPREGQPGIFATSMATTSTDPQWMVVLLAHNAKEVMDQMIDPFVVSIHKDTP